jgi:hypothetical protein
MIAALYLLGSIIATLFDWIFWVNQPIKLGSECHVHWQNTVFAAVKKNWQSEQNLGVGLGPF